MELSLALLEIFLEKEVVETRFKKHLKCGESLNGFAKKILSKSLHR